MALKSPYLKFAAVAWPLLLVAAFVSHRAGAFDRPKPQSVLTSAELEAYTDEQSLFLYSSKSGPVFVPDSAPPAAPPEFLSGSKSLILVRPNPDGTPAAAKPDGARP